jgi:hypothetical protein
MRCLVNLFSFVIVTLPFANYLSTLVLRNGEKHIFATTCAFTFVQIQYIKLTAVSFLFMKLKLTCGIYCTVQ